MVCTGSSQSCIQACFRFHGVSSHAAGAPHLGRSALDAVELMDVGVNYMREHMEDSDRVHYAITNTGGKSPNVVQAEAEEMCIRDSILIEDFNEIKSPSSLKYSPDEKTLAFTIVQPDKENNKYSKNLWIMEENKEAVQLTSSGKDGDFIWEDEQTILFVSERSEKKDDLEEKTTFYRINIHGGEAKQAFSVSRSVSFFKKLSDGLYCMGIEENRNSLPLDADEKLRKEEKDYHVIDEVPVWGNGCLLYTSLFSMLLH